MIHVECAEGRITGKIDGTQKELLTELMSIVSSLKDSGMDNELIAVAVATGLSGMSDEFLKDMKEMN